jgi:hypothetical protein
MERSAWAKYIAQEESGKQMCLRLRNNDPVKVCLEKSIDALTALRSRRHQILGFISAFGKLRLPSSNPRLNSHNLQCILLIFCLDEISHDPNLCDVVLKHFEELHVNLIELYSDSHFTSLSRTLSILSRKINAPHPRPLPSLLPSTKFLAGQTLLHSGSADYRLYFVDSGVVWINVRSCYIQYNIVIYREQFVNASLRCGFADF